MTQVNPIKQGCYNRVLPAVYSDELSYYEMLAKLKHKLNELIKVFNEQTELYATIELLNKSQNEQDKVWAAQLSAMNDALSTRITSEVDRLEKIIAETVAGKVTVFDPTYGIEPRPVEQVIKNVYHWLRYYADYAVTIDNLLLSAEARDAMALEARTFDLYSMQYYSKSDIPAPTNPDDYVKKHDILAYYFDRKD